MEFLVNKIQNLQKENSALLQQNVNLELLLSNANEKIKELSSDLEVCKANSLILQDCQSNLK